MPARNLESIIYVELAAYSFNILLFFLLSLSELHGLAAWNDINLASLAFPNLFFISAWLYLRKMHPREFFLDLRQGILDRSPFLRMHLVFSVFLTLIYTSSVAMILFDRIALPSWIFHLIQNGLGMSLVFSMILALLESDSGPKGPRKKKKTKLLVIKPLAIFSR